MTENPTDIFDFFIFKHLGLLFFVLAIFFSGLQKLYSLFRIKKYPELKQGYEKLILGYLVFTGLPWLIVALGELFYAFPGIIFFFLLSEGNLFSWLLYIVLFCEYIFLIVWVWFFDGGEYLYKYQLAFYKFRSPVIAKTMVFLMAIGGIIGFIFLIAINFD